MVNISCKEKGFMVRSILLTASIVVVLALASSPFALFASPLRSDTGWTQVNDDGFGMESNGSYGAEESYEVLVFNDQLYVGMEADSRSGARLWRTKPGVTVPSGQDDWQEVAAAGTGEGEGEGVPFGDTTPEHPAGWNDHVDSLAEFRSMLYVSTANISGTHVYRSTSGNPSGWTLVADPGFGDVGNTNFKDMQVFDGYLCGGTQNGDTGAQVWCTRDGTTWNQKNSSGFGERANRGIWSGMVFQDALYFGTHHIEAGTQRGKLYRTRKLDGVPQWEEVYRGPVGSVRVDIVGEFAGYVYIATQSLNGIAVLRSPDGSEGSWERVSSTGMDGSVANRGMVVDGGAVYRDALYVAVSNTETGVEVWRTTGEVQPNGLVDWTQVGSDGVGDPNNSLAQLVVFNDYLYAWTTNEASGQQVRRTLVELSPVYQVYLPLVQ